jgi:hypothetical protein
MTEDSDAEEDNEVAFEHLIFDGQIVSKGRRRGE